MRWVLLLCDVKIFGLLVVMDFRCVVALVSSGFWKMYFRSGGFLIVLSMRRKHKILEHVDAVIPCSPCSWRTVLYRVCDGYIV